MLAAEEWLPIEGYEGSYDVSSYGNVRCKSRYLFRIGRGKELHTLYRPAKLITPKNRGKYKSVVLASPSGKKNFSIHRLVAQAFILNQNNLPVVNHIDENKYNNTVSNLEWCTLSYNLSYSLSKVHLYLSPDGEEVSITNHREFCRDYGLKQMGLWRLRNGKQSQHKGWRVVS
jgi:hypothetical protein